MIKIETTAQQSAMFIPIIDERTSSFRSPSCLCCLNWSCHDFDPLFSMACLSFTGLWHEYILDIQCPFNTVLKNKDYG